MLRQFLEVRSYLQAMVGPAQAADAQTLTLQMLPTLNVNGQHAPFFQFIGGRIVVPRYIPGDLRGLLQSYQRELDLWRQGARNPFFVVDTDLIVIHPGDRDDSGNLIVLHRPVLAEILRAGYPNLILPSALMQLLIQIVAGTQIKNDGDGRLRSSETRKSQARDLRGRLGASSTADVSRIVGAMILRTVVTAVERHTRPDDAAFFRHMERYYPADVQAIVLTSRTGQRHRVVAMGPADARPVILLHPLILPSVTADDVEWLAQNRLRLYWPLRLGQLAPQEGPTSEVETLDHALDGIDLVRRNFCGPMVPIVSIAAASKVAIAYARQHPERVDLLCFAAACVLKDRPEAGARRLAKVMLHILDSAPWLADGALRLTARQLLSDKAFRSYLPKHYAGSPADSDLIAAELAREDGAERMREALDLSLQSIRHDFGFQLNLAWDQARHLSVPMHMVHGMQDQVHPIELIRRLAATLPGVRLHEMPNAGQLLAGHALRATLAHVGALIEPRDRSLRPGTTIA